MPLKETAAEDNFQKGHRQRLRERFLRGGAEALADYELLEMLLFAAHPRGDVKPLAKRLLKHCGSFAKVLHAPPVDLAQVEGAGEAVIAALKAAEAVAQRLLREEAKKGAVLSSWTALLDYCHVSMAHQKIEQFRILFLNQKNELIADEVQQSGTINHTPVYPREVVKRALEIGAAAIILAHNHPSGDPTPSAADIEITKQIVQAGKPLGIAIHDHLIIGKFGHYSFKSNGLL
jgi:DNA repair protein RadC